MVIERVLCTLTSSESKRLICRAIANLPEVKKAFEEGIVFIATSTTTAYLAEELLNQKIQMKGFFTAGVIVPRGICATSLKRRLGYIAIEKGVATNVTRSELRDEWLPKMGPDDVFIKGANAIDPSGLAAILLGNAHSQGRGGTIGTAIGTLSTRGVHLIIAAGLEKLVPNSLIKVAPKVGGPFKYSAGLPSGMIIVSGKLITEVEAFKILTDVDVIPIAAGGVCGAEGSHTFILRGASEVIDTAWEIFKSIKGEPPLTTVTMNCDECQRGCAFNTDPELIRRRRTQEILGGY